MSRAYFGNDQRPHVQADWTVPPSQASTPVDFIIDSGATRTAIDRPTSIGTTVKGYVAVSVASGASQQAVLLTGGRIELEVIDNITRQTVTVSHTGDVLLQAVNVLGVDAIHGTRIRLVMDMSVAPPALSLEV